MVEFDVETSTPGVGAAAEPRGSTLSRRAPIKVGNMKGWLLVVVMTAKNTRTPSRTPCLGLGRWNANANAPTR